MSAPSKPWERDYAGPGGGDQRMRLESSASLPTMSSAVRPTRQQMPAVPARPWLSRSHARLSGYGYGTSSPYMPGGYGNYGNYGGYGGYSNYGGYGSYNSYGGYGFGGNRYGMHGPEDPENRFIQIAEEATRPAFDSIQSVVDAFGSVSFMLDSTYQAVVHTFRAVLGIAEHLGQLRSVFAALNVFRLVRWAYRKLCQLLGINIAVSQESIWNGAAAVGDETSGDVLSTEQSAPKWPIFVYFAIVVSGPLLMWRLLRSLSVGSTEDSKFWDVKKQPASQFSIVAYPFTAQTSREVSVSPGKLVGIAPNKYQTELNSGWILVSADRRTSGLIPVNYLQEAQYSPNKKPVPVNGSTTVPSAAPTTYPVTTPQQPVISYPIPTATNPRQENAFTSIDTSSNSNHRAAIDSSSVSVPRATNTTVPKSDPQCVPFGGALPTLPVPEKNPSPSMYMKIPQTADVEQTVNSTFKSNVTNNPS